MGTQCTCSWCFPILWLCVCQHLRSKFMDKILGFGCFYNDYGTTLTCVVLIIQLICFRYAVTARKKGPLLVAVIPNVSQSFITSVEKTMDHSSSSVTVSSKSLHLYVHSYWYVDIRLCLISCCQGDYQVHVGRLAQGSCYTLQTEEGIQANFLFIQFT